MHFEILGEPVGEGRPRAVRMGPMVRMHSAPKSAEWRALAAQQIRSERGAQQLDGVVFLRVLAVGRRPASLPKKQIERIRRPTKPDIDNVLKSVMDALVTGGAIVDDKQVVSVIANKVTAAVGELPRVVIDVHAYAGDDE